MSKYTEKFIADESFVNKMVNSDRNFAQKIYDWVKNKINYYKTIAKMEPKQIAEYDNLRKAEKLWEKALKGVKKNNNGVKYSSIYNEDGTFNRVKIDEDIFKDRNGRSINKIIKDYLIQHIGEYADIIESGQRVYLGEDLPNEYAFSKSTNNLEVANKMAKGRAVADLKEIINNVSNRRYEANKKEKHNIDGKFGFYKYDTTFSFEQAGKERIFTGIVLIRNDANGKKYLYDILNIKKIGSNLPSVAPNSKKSLAIIDGQNSLPTNSISQSNDTVNINNMQKSGKNTQKIDTKYSLSDNKGEIKLPDKEIEDYTYKDIDSINEQVINNFDEEISKSANDLLREHSSDLYIKYDDIDKEIENILNGNLNDYLTSNFSEELNDTITSELNNRISEALSEKIKAEGYNYADSGLSMNSNINDGYNEMIDFLDNNNIDYEISKSTNAGIVPSVYIKDSEGETIARVGNHYNSNMNGTELIFDNKDYINWKESIIKKIAKKNTLFEQYLDENNVKYSLEDKIYNKRSTNSGRRSKQVV